MTAAELRLTVPSLVKALAIHFDHDATQAVIGVIVPKDRVIHSRMVIINKNQLTLAWALSQKVAFASAVIVILT